MGTWTGRPRIDGKARRLYPHLARGLLVAGRADFGHGTAVVAVVQIVPVRRAAQDVSGGTAAIIILSETKTAAGPAMTSA